MLGGPEVAVLGGGFGGLYTALRLSSMDWSGGPTPHVTLVDRNERFAFSPMLYELATGTAATWEVAPPYEEVLDGTGVDFVQADVLTVDAEVGQVGVLPASRAEASGVRMLPYDRCVVALGSEPTFGGVPGASEHAMPFSSLADALAVRERVADLLAAKKAARREADGAGSRERLSVAVIGGGYIGVELAANLAATLAADSPTASITLVQRADALLPTATDFARATAQRRLEEAGVELLLSTQVESVGPGGVVLRGAADDEASERPTDLVLWAAGARPAELLERLGLPRDEAGCLAVGPSLAVEGSDARIFGLGDAAAVTDARGDRAPPSAQAAMQQAEYAAWNLRASLRGDALLPFRYANLGEMVSLGGDSAAVSALGLLQLDGPLASTSRRAVYAARMPTAKQAAKVGFSWAVDKAFDVARRAIDNKPPFGRASKGPDL